jgi:hypothetical protein
VDSLIFFHIPYFNLDFFNMPPLEICRPGSGPLWPVRKYGPVYTPRTGDRLLRRPNSTDAVQHLLAWTTKEELLNAFRPSCVGSAPNPRLGTNRPPPPIKVMILLLFETLKNPIEGRNDPKCATPWSMCSRSVLVLNVLTNWKFIDKNILQF